MSRYLLIPTLFSTLVLAWALNHFSMDRLQLPTTLVRGIYWFQNGELEDWTDRQDQSRLLLATRELHKLDGLLRQLQLPVQPVAVVFSFTQRQIVDIQADRIFLGADWIDQEGVLGESVLRAWLLQILPPTLAKDALRSSVIVDVLRYFMNGSIFTNANIRDMAWLEQLKPLAQVCRTQELPLDWRALCKPLAARSASSWFETSMHRMSLRSFFAQGLQSQVMSLAWHERAPALREWLQNLKAIPAADTAPVKGWMEWARWVQKEKTQLALLPQALNQSSVLPKLDYLAHLEIDRAIVGFSGLQERALIAEDKAHLRVRHWIWESCQIPRVQDILDLAGQAQKFLFVQTCQWPPRPLRYELYLQTGAEVFARENKNLIFATGHVGSLQLAVQRGLVSPQSLVTDLHRLQTLHWDRLAQAYRVESAIESMQWVRPPPGI